VIAFTGQTNNDTGSSTLIIFARFPRLGTVKSRLAPHLTEEGCLELHLAFLFDTIERTQQLGVERYLYLAGCSVEEAREFSEYHSFSQIHLGIQEGSDLGEKMRRAYLNVRGQETDKRVVFLGADTPSLPLSYVRSAFSVLGRVPVVIGPVADGGYFLIGLSADHPDLFCDIPWGSSQVYQASLTKLEGWDYESLPMWYDVDRWEDLIKLAADLEREFEGFPQRSLSYLQKRGIAAPSTVPRSSVHRITCPVSENKD
jgi:rSAM/selenodomain-associated transferase 1